MKLFTNDSNIYLYFTKTNEDWFTISDDAQVYFDDDLNINVGYIWY